MDKDFWIKKWEKSETRFHQADYHLQLKKFGNDFSPGTILVPLCGKSLDMLFLKSLGHKVIGVELSPIACRDFFSENKIPFQQKTIKNFTVFESDSLSIYCGDFFNLPSEVWENISGIYDRAALVALSPDIRQKYTAEIVKRSPEKSEILLISYEYPEGFINPPPFSVPEDEVLKHFGDCEIKKLVTHNEIVRDVVVKEKTFWVVT